MNIAVLYGSYRGHRKGINAAKWMVAKLRARKHKVVLIDAKQYKLPFLNKMHKEYPQGKAPKNMEKVHKLLKAADAFVLVCGEYNHSMPPGFKNLLDTYQREFYFKPSAIVTYSAGGFGGVRAAVHVRVIAGELGMPSISSMFAISKVQDAFDANGKDLTGNYDKRVGRFLDELEWYTTAFKNQRKKGTPY